MDERRAGCPLRQAVRVRWQALFDDLEAQLEAAEAAELAGEVAERARLAVARVRTADRLAAGRGLPVGVLLPGTGTLRGVLRDAGEDWLLLEEGGGREALVPLAAVLGVTGLPRAAPPAEDVAARPAAAVARALDLRWALRALVRDRTGVAVVLVDGSVLAGTLDRVGADHLDLAEHPPGEARRAAAVRSVRLVPLAAVALVRSS